MKVYDCFMFFNELDIVELRFEELYHSVDYFVIAESNVTHAGNPKPYIFLDNWDRFTKFHDKIRHIKVDDVPENVGGMFRDKFQREALSRGLSDLHTDDLVIVSDLDEIPRAELIDMIKTDENQYERYMLNLPQFRHRLNFMKVRESHKYTNVIVTRGRAFTDPHRERELTFPWTAKPANSVILEHGGWHFTWLGNDQEVAHKLSNFAHTELNTEATRKNINIDDVIKNKKSFLPDHDEEFEYVIIDDYFPNYVKNNLDKWQHLIIQDAVKEVTEIYKD
ncbi:MAG: hypothetical protein EBU90_19160 [Proteobacteria bacterium]|nr:hypothetical protein [Pseudomonadota bacterium]NBP16475.1 hypothetical protein [bacterium]